MLPIHLIDGWGTETQTKPFHQFSFASEYAMLAVRLLRGLQSDGVEAVEADAGEIEGAETVYSLDGVALGRWSEVAGTLQPGIYVVGGRKVKI